MHFVGNLDKSIYRCITEDITTNAVVITDERIQHIEDHHPGEYEEIEQYLPMAISAPDYILKDRVNTGLILKSFDMDGKHVQVVLRLHTSTDKPEYKNSIISAWRISTNRLESYLRNKQILYKRQQS